MGVVSLYGAAWKYSIHLQCPFIKSKVIAVKQNLKMCWFNQEEQCDLPPKENSFGRKTYLSLGTIRRFCQFLVPFDNRTNHRSIQFVN